MSTPEHTLGPWKQVGGTEVWEERAVYRICNCGGSYGPRPNAMRANARLIAAAPDLLEACKALEPRLDRAGRGDLQCGPAGKDRDWETLKASLRAAIAKAEGRS